MHQSSWQRRQQVASLALSCCLFVLALPTKSQQQQQQTEAKLSEHDHYQLMQSPRMVAAYQINHLSKRPAADLQQQQQQQVEWSPLRDFKRPVESMRTAESVLNPTGLLPTTTTTSVQQQHQHQNQSTSQASRPQVRPCEQSRQLAANSRIINRRHVNSHRLEGIVDQPVEQRPQFPATGQRPVLLVPTNNNNNSNAREEADENEEEEEEDDDQPDNNNNNNSTTRGKPNGREPLAGNESVSLESSMAPPGYEHPSQFMNQEESSPGGPQDEHPPVGDANEEANEAPPDEAAERSEQEAAEASEAEAANRSALDEQQQAQREIILAQAQSEAKAIKEQQEALLRQQQLQQQMLLKRHQNDLEFTQRDHHQHGQNQRAPNRRTGGSGGRSSRPIQMTEEGPAEHHRHSANPPDRRNQPSPRRQQAPRPMTAVASSTASTARRAPQLDIQFSDQSGGPDQQVNQEVNSDLGGSNNLHQDELGVDYSVRRPIVSTVTAQGAAAPQEHQQQYGNLLEFDARNLIGGSDLLPAAQHHYGAHYGSLGGHHKGAGHYYQFAESHKKGQFDSGYKRGGKKFHISGHSSQHGSHAEGHVKWHAKKGKGMHYWDYKHKAKKMGHHHHYGHY